ncbi:MAG: leucine-rich repeat protein [Clostridia bacterium]|nr:leucine-rich repeat protein [Clostridia bacterium]
MKKVLKIILISVICALTALSMIACTPENPGDPQAGFKYSKTKDGVYVISGYVGEETEVTVDIADATKIRIKKDAFAGNNTITDLTVSNKVVEIDEGAFAKMGALETLTVPFIGQYFNSDATYSQTGSANQSQKAINKARTVAHFFGTEEYDDVSVAVNSKYFANASDVSTTCYVPLTFTTIKVVANEDYAIPMDAFNGFDTPNEFKVILSGNITAIGERAFKDSGIKSIEIPASMQTIYQNAFENSKLNTVTVLAINAITVKDFAFKGCTKMVKFGATEDYKIDLAKVNNQLIGEYAFDFGIENKTFELLNASSFDNNQLSFMFGETEFVK